MLKLHTPTVCPLRFTIDDAPATAPHRPTVRAGVARGFNSYTVPNVATVAAWPHRPLAHARQVARRIHRDRTYLLVCGQCDVDGVLDLRPAPPAAYPRLASCC